MQEHGYYRWPTVAQGRVVFVAEDDLWSVSIGGGIARRLTSGLGQASRPRLSPDGRLLAFTANEEGHAEVYVMDADGGVPRRLTWLGDQANVMGWTPEGDIAFTTMAQSAFFRDWRMHTVPAAGGEPSALPWGLGSTITYAEDGRVAIGWHTEDIAWWKRYRGGRVGVIHVSDPARARFHGLTDGLAQVCAPMWIGERVYYVSDHEFTGNLYSSLEDGSDLRRHTDSEDHYVRWPSTDGERIVYVHGANLRVLDVATGEDRELAVELRGPGTQRRRKFVDPKAFLEGAAVHPDGRSIGLVVRGKPVLMGAWEGPAQQLGEARDGSVRTRLLRWIDDERVLMVDDADGDDSFVVREAASGRTLQRFSDLDVGGLLELTVDPTGQRAAFTNHRYQLGCLSLASGTVDWIDRSPASRISGPTWSSCGSHLAWSSPTSADGERARIRLYRAADGAVVDVTDGRYSDFGPAWDPRGRYLYFVSGRDFDPVYDAVYFDLNFTWSQRPFAVTLTAAQASPFDPEPHPLAGEEAESSPIAEPIAVEFDGIADRLVAFPVPPSRYARILGVHAGLLLVTEPVQGAMRVDWRATGAPAAERTLALYDFDQQRMGTLVTGITDAAVDRSGKSLLLTVSDRLRLIKMPKKLGPKPLEKPSSNDPGRTSGWIDLARVSVSVEPAAEWRQMARETWRLMRDHFWNPQMSGVDWEAIWDRYEPLLGRVGSRSEYSDLVWCMVGETGTSHCYEMLGDYRKHPTWSIGKLGAQLSWDGAAAGFRIDRIVRGEAGDRERSSPLCAPGVGVNEGDVLVAVDGQPLSPTSPPGAALVDKADRRVAITVASGGSERTVSVRLLGNAMKARYRQWVLANQRRVHEASDGRLGYVHIPDMGAPGYSEFHRDYLSEVERQGLIVDVRYNRGGHVSQLLIEKLARRIVGWDMNRHGLPFSYPAHAPRGPLVALTNGFAGSDGDIFSHVWKLNDLGPLIGERTWGGVVGIWPRFRHVDGSITTQPEFAFWFEDVGFGVENYGTDPDEVVRFGPEDYAAGRDPQLARAVKQALELLESTPPAPPDFGPVPNLGRPS
ncbi:MAG: peptidase [Proteobacteria bacterium]|nr:peptidase [Pseudomonadota bacterium]